MKQQDKQGALRDQDPQYLTSVIRCFLGMLVFFCISSVNAVPASSNPGKSGLPDLERDLSQARGFNGKNNQERSSNHARAATQQDTANEGEVGIEGFVTWAKNLWTILLDKVRYGSWYWKIIPLALIWIVYSKFKS